MEEILAPTLVRFEGAEICEAWTDARHVPNQFVPSFYQGISSFDRCLQDASEEFIRPRAQKVCDDVAALLESIPGIVFRSYSSASPGLRQAFDDAWKAFTDNVMQELRRQVMEKVDAERRFATINDHYLQAEYSQQLFTPESLEQQLVKAVQEVDKLERLQPDFEAILEKHMTRLVKTEATEFQKMKLHAAVKAYWEVTRKRVSDTIMQCVRDVMIRDGWEIFHRGLLGLDSIKKACEESDTIKRRRDKHIKLEEDMNECLRKAQNL